VIASPWFNCANTADMSLSADLLAGARGGASMGGGGGGGGGGPPAEGAGGAGGAAATGAAGVAEACFKVLLSRAAPYKVQ